MTDDASTGYLAERQKAPQNPWQEMKAESQPEEKPMSFELLWDGAKSVVGDIGRGIVEAPTQAIGGVAEAVGETIETGEEILTGMFGEAPLLQFIDPETGDWDIELISQKAFEAKGGKKLDFDDLEIKEPESVTGGLIRSTAQFLTGFLPANKVAQGTKLAQMGKAGSTAAAMGAGAIADAVVFDGSEGRLSDFINENIPALSNPVTEFLSTEKDDSELEGKLKNSIEGLAIGGLTEPLFNAIKAVRKYGIDRRKAKEADAAAKAEAEQIDRLAEVEEPDFIPVDDIAGEEMTVQYGGGAGKADPEDAMNINLNNLETTQDVDDLIESIATVESKSINAERREKITLEEQEALADNLGMTLDELLSRRKGQAFNAEQAVAARKLLVASGENLVRLAKKAKTGTNEDLFVFRKAMAQHLAIQQQVSGMTAEAGRALGSFRIKAKGADMQQQMINEAIETTGGDVVGRRLAQAISSMDSVKGINKTIRLAEKKNLTTDMIYEVWVNGLLSSPTTHLVNVLGNSLTIASALVERRVARGVGRLRGEENIPSGEAQYQLQGALEGLKDGIRLAAKTLRTGEPQDALEKVEQQQHRRITSENLELAGAAGRTADFIGNVVRTPGTMLSAGDAFFKSVGYRMELHAQAYRTAVQEGLDGDALHRRIAEIIDSPPENIELSAIDYSRYQTFTNELGDWGKAVQAVQQKIPAARVIMPFVRTPTNIAKYALERTPVAAAMPHVREELAAGGARRDLALAKIAVGSTVMMIAADYTLSGDITGASPANADMRAVWLENNQEYSIRVGDKWVAYNRLDPVGMIIGLAADVAQIAGDAREADVLDISTASAIAVGQNLMSKTYLQGVMDFLDMVAGVKADPNNEGATAPLERYMNRLAGSVVPAGVAHVERVISPEVKATYTMLEKIQSRVPGWSESLPPRRNIFGEKVILEGGVGLDIMSPIYQKEVNDDPVIDEILKNQSIMRMPRKVQRGVELDPWEYDRLLELVAHPYEYMRTPLRDRLEMEIYSAGYANAAGGGEGTEQSLRLEAIYSSYKQAALGQLLKENPGLKFKMEQANQEKAVKFRGY